jgi:hypothetical protein
MVKVSLFWLFTAVGMAGTINIGFESPDYFPGNINMQQGWSNTGNFDAQVTLAAGYEGSQSMRISNGISSSAYGNQPFTPHLLIPAGESSVPGAVDTFYSSWYFKSVTGQLQDGLGITVSADSGVGTRMTYLRMADDASNGMNLQFYDFGGTPEDFQYQMLVTHLDRTVWHRIDMNIHFVDGPGNDGVQIFLDGQLLVNGTTWEDYSRSVLQPDGSPGLLPPVNSLLFRAGGGPAVTSTLGAGFYIDDISLTSLDTPEPGAWRLALAGLLSLLAYRLGRICA